MATKMSTQRIALVLPVRLLAVCAALCTGYTNGAAAPRSGNASG
jgi:hypothetical protein